MSPTRKAVERQVRRGLLKAALILVYALLGLIVGVFVGRVLLAEGTMGFDAVAAALSGALVGMLIGVIVGGIFAFSRRGAEAVRRSRRALFAGLAALILCVIGVWIFAGDRADENVQRPVPEQSVTPVPE